MPIDPRRRRLRSEIVVDDTREIAAFLRLTAAEGGWRVVIVDGADEMNRNAANALLKILEEPPRRALLLLVAHSPGTAAADDTFALPALSDDAAAAFDRVAASRNLPARPAGGGSAALIALGRMAASGERSNSRTPAGSSCIERSWHCCRASSGVDPAALHALADRLARAEADDAYRAVEELLSHVLGEIAVGAAGGSSGRRFCPESDRVLRRLCTRAPAARWAELREQIAAIFARSDALNLDRKQTILGAFFAIERTAR